MNRSLWALAVFAVALALPTGAQVTARQGGPEEEGEPTVTEVPSPMVLELVVPAWTPEKRAAKLQWTSSETAKFVTDKARIRRVSITRLPKPERGEASTNAQVDQGRGDGTRDQRDRGIRVDAPRR